MATPYRDVDGSPHRAVMSNLLDIQARLRGDPASLIQARDGRRDEIEIALGGVSVVASADAQVDDQAPIEDRLPFEREAPDTDEAQRRIESLRRRLAFLEMEIDAYEHAAPAADAGEPVHIDAPVTELQQAVDERLSGR